MATECTCIKCGVIKGLPKVDRISPVDVLYKCPQCGSGLASYTIDAADITRMPDDIAGSMLDEMYC